VKESGVRIQEGLRSMHALDGEMGFWILITFSWHLRSVHP
jgi:hypothetical protein